MRKRVSLAQTFILNPQILLMDDRSRRSTQTRQLMENELLDLWSAERKSVVFITTTWKRRSRSPIAWSCCRRGRTRTPSENTGSILGPRDVSEIR
jgi:NitT/TauT family transport system ATP-binding protein